MLGKNNKDGELVFDVEQSAGGGFVARAVGESIFTQADSIDDLHAAIREAVECHFGDRAIPSVIRLRIVREEILRL
jgi:hypothetical protein